MQPRPGRRPSVVAAVAATLVACGGGAAGAPAPTAFSIRGTVTGAPAGVTVTLSGTASATTSTDAAGAFHFEGLSNGSYTARPALADWLFVPASRPVEVAGADRTGQDFTASLVTATHLVAGTVTGAGAGVTVELYAGSASSSVAHASNVIVTPLRQTTTDAAGRYAFADVANGRYTVRAGVAGKLVTPPARTVKLAGADLTDRDFTLASQACSADGWCWENPLPQGNPLAAVWGSGADDVWAVGASSTILRWNGAAWSLLPGARADLKAVWGSSGSDVWVAGARGALLHWDGTALTAVSSGTTGDLLAGWSAAPDDAWAVGAGGTVLHWDGRGWRPRASGTTEDLGAVWGASASDVWFVGAAGTALRWNGAALADFPTGLSERLTGVWGASASDVWAVGAGGSTLRWNGSAGAVTSGTSGYAAIWGSAADQIWRVQLGGAFELWDGTRWLASRPPMHGTTALWGSSSGDAWAVGSDGVVAHLDEGDWSSWEQEGAGSCQSIWGSSGDDVWAGGLHRDARGWSSGGMDAWYGWAATPTDGWAIAGGTAKHWDGTTWTNTVLTSGTLTAIWGASSTAVWVAGWSSVLRWDGSGWTAELTAPPGESLLIDDLWGSSADDVWAVGSQGTVYHRTGAGWAKVLTGAPEDYHRVWGSGPTDVWVAPFSGGAAIHWNGTAWESRPVPAVPQLFLFGLWGRAPNDVWAAGTGGAHHWDGTAWSFTAAPDGWQFGDVWGTADDTFMVRSPRTILRRAR